MHIQTMEEGAKSGPNFVKVWLEERGRRIFELAEGRPKPAQLAKLREEVDRQRSAIEDGWISMMISKNWLTVERHGSVITLRAYPGRHEHYERFLDLHKEFTPDYTEDALYRGAKFHVDLDRVHVALRVGRRDDPDLRDSWPLADLLFT